ncbi:hypothetical protein BGZ63DRAFT_270965 [Mariannaea sp. PMI_226]|nr:hypothetical protein BGZ63DRAFT_270965 [Mariannaea sp. PMI_226]
MRRADRVYESEDEDGFVCSKLDAVDVVHHNIFQANTCKIFAIMLRPLLTLILIIFSLAHVFPHHTTSPEVISQTSTVKASLQSPSALRARLTTISNTTDYRTASPGTYTLTVADSSVLVIIVTVVKSTTTVTYSSKSASPSPMPPCPDECDCSWIKDKESEE